MTFFTIEQIKRANETLGHHWFSKKTLRFFKSRIHPNVYGGKYFVSSEQGPDGVRRYSVRMAEENGAITTVGNFQRYATRQAAHNVAKKLAKEN